MTLQEQIDYTRDWTDNETVLAVCDLAERALALDPTEHRLIDVAINHTAATYRPICGCRSSHRVGEGDIVAACSADFDSLDAAVRAWAAHAGIGETDE